MASFRCIGRFCRIFSRVLKTTRGGGMFSTTPFLTLLGVRRPEIGALMSARRRAKKGKMAKLKYDGRSQTPIRLKLEMVPSSRVTVLSLRRAVRKFVQNIQEDAHAKTKRKRDEDYLLPETLLPRTFWAGFFQTPASIFCSSGRRGGRHRRRRHCRPCVVW